jgi:hypothetical protein
MVYPCLPNVLQHSAERGEVSMNIVDGSDPHTPILAHR